MRIKQLKMQSFRGIGDLIIDFDEKEPVDEKPKQELPKPENKTDVQDDVDYI
jgi:hypothetical protein